MFASFENVFRKDGCETKSVPKAFVEYLNSFVPEEFFYRVDEKEGICVLNGKNENMHFSGMHLVLSEKQRRIIGDRNSIEDILFFSYNSQQPIRIQPDKENEIVIDGKKIALNQLLVAPFSPYFSIEKDGLWLIPPTFPKPRQIELGEKEFSIDVPIQRVPNESVDKEKFASADDKSVLQLSLLVDRNTYECTLNLTVFFALAKNVENIVKAAAIYNSFVEGKGKVNGKKWASKAAGVNSEVKKVDSVFLSFWKKAYEVEKILNKTFRIPSGSIDYKTARDLERLYQGLVKQQPIKNEKHVEEISFDDEEGIGDKAKKIEKPVLLAFNRVISIELFQEKMDLPAFTCVFNTRIGKVVKDGRKVVVSLEDEDSGKKGFSSTLIFADTDAKNRYLEKGIDAIVDRFRLSKTVDEYMNVK